MTTPVTPYRSPRPVGRDGFAQLLAAEWTKFRTVRGWVITLAAVPAAVVLLAFLGAAGSHTGFCTGSDPAHATCTDEHPPVPIGPDGEPVADTFTFAHQPLVGDGSLTVRITSLSGAHAAGGAVAVSASPNGQPEANLEPGLAAWAKAGIMVEKDTSEGSPYAAVMVTGGNGVRMQYDYTEDVPGDPASVTADSPQWLRLSRAGDLLTGYDSTDGAHWTKIGTARLTGLPAAVQIGLFVTSPLFFAPDSSEGAPSLATARFDQTAAAGDLPSGAWTSEALGAGDTGGAYPALSSAPSWFQQSGDAFTLSGSGDIAPFVVGALGNDRVGTSLLVGGMAGVIVLIVLATLFVTSEYRRGLIHTTFAASPRRGRVLAAKAVVVGGVAFVAGLVGTTLAEVVARRVLTAHGNYLFPLSGLTEARVVVGTALALAFAAVLVLAVAMAVRRSAAAVVAGAVLLVLPFILATTLPPGASNWLMRLTPTAAFAVQDAQPRSALVTNAYTLVKGYYPLAPWAGLAVLLGYAGVAIGATVWLLRRRDV